MSRLTSALAFVFFLTVAVARGGDVLTAADQIAQENLRYVYGSDDVARGGLDCSAFVRLVFRDGAAIDLPNEADKQLEYVREHGQVWDAASGWTPETLQPGDLIFYAGPHALPRISQVSHVMLYCGNGIMVGAQGKGRQLNGVETGVGYYPFHIRPPLGILGESGERFINHWSLFAYGRLKDASVPASNLVAAGALENVSPLGQETGVASSEPVFTLKPCGINPRFD